MAILDVAEQLVGQDIHREIQGAPCRTLLALKTVLDFFSADPKNLGLQRHIFIGCLPVKVHSFTPILGREDISGIVRRGIGCGGKYTVIHQPRLLCGTTILLMPYTLHNGS
jgi:hypothetical protein